MQANWLLSCADFTSNFKCVLAAVVLVSLLTLFLFQLTAIVMLGLTQESNFNGTAEFTSNINKCSGSEKAFRVNVTLNLYSRQSYVGDSGVLLAKLYWHNI